MTLDKIRRLIALAAHPTTPVEEARTSAVTACRLIVEHKLDLRSPNDLGPASSGVFVDWLELFRAIFQSVSRTNRSGVSDFMSYARTRPRPPPRPKMTVDDFMRATRHAPNPAKGGTKKRRKRRAKRRGQ